MGSEGKPLYAVYGEQEGKRTFLIYNEKTTFFGKKINQILCSEDLDSLKGYVNALEIPFRRIDTGCSFVDIEPLVREGVILKRNLADLTEHFKFTSYTYKSIKKPLWNNPSPHNKLCIIQ